MNDNVLRGRRLDGGARAPKTYSTERKCAAQGVRDQPVPIQPSGPLFRPCSDEVSTPSGPHREHRSLTDDQQG